MDLDVAGSSPVSHPFLSFRKTKLVFPALFGNADLPLVFGQTCCGMANELPHSAVEEYDPWQAEVCLEMMLCGLFVLH